MAEECRRSLGRIWVDGRTLQPPAPRRQPLFSKRQWARGLLCGGLPRQSAGESCPHPALADATATDKSGAGIQ